MIDRATIYAVASRLWASASGLLTAMLVAALFTPELQGYYFTFLSLLTLQTFVELGFGELLQQFVSHEWAKSTSSDSGERDRAHSRLASLFRFSLRWYGGVALLLFAALGAGGSWYFHVFSKGEAVSWRLAWWISAGATSLAVLLTPLFSILEGANRVEKVNRLRFLQGFSSRIAGFLAIASGFGLLTIAVTRAVSFSIGLAGLGHEALDFARRLWRAPAGLESVSYRRELWPLQWKFALSWLSGYLLYSLFTPVLFAFHGPELAGRMGMTAAAATAISSAAFAVMATKVPRLAMLAAEREYPAMDALFRRAAWSSVLVSAAGAALFLSALALGRKLDLGLASRFLPPLESALFLGALVLQQLRYAMGSYLRAHKAEPYAMLSLFEGVAAVPLLSLLGKELGPLGMILGFLLLTTATLVPAFRIFQRFRRMWHLPRLAEAS